MKRLISCEFNMDTACVELKYLTDVGVNSECSRVPLLLSEDTVQTDGVSEYRFTKDPFWGWLLWQRLSGHDWKRLYGFTEEPQEDTDYVMPCIYCDLHPTSPMNKYEKISVFIEDANIRIWSGNYQVFRRGVRETDERVNEDRKKELLREVFGIVPEK